MAAMLRVWRVSGEELISIPVEELTNAGELKRRLQSVCGWPKSFQRLLHEGAPLEDDAQLDEPMDVQLVMLPLETGFGSSQDQLNSALADAAAEGELEIITQLLEAGADKDLEDDRGCAPLCAACLHGQTEAVTLLLDAGARTNVQDDDGGTPLCLACTGGHADIVVQLLRAGADPDLRCPLINADDQGHTEIVKLLLEHGADADCIRCTWSDPSIRRGSSFGSGSSF
ncbi:ASB3 [Symbiodinium sp. CCMP2592]|nr:ASB3 [Symbiodinium sp. CCMP2592]